MTRDIDAANDYLLLPADKGETCGCWDTRDDGSIGPCGRPADMTYDWAVGSYGDWDSRLHVCFDHWDKIRRLEVAERQVNDHEAQ